METTELLALLADALTYPGPGFAQVSARCTDALGRAPAEVADRLAHFVSFTDRPIEEMQERFVATFDFDPKRSLDIGWHLFGENYDRGDFLVRMRDLLVAHGIDEAGNLPDHLPHVLRLLGRMPPDQAADLVRTAVLPALDKLLEALTTPDDPYTSVIACVRTVVSTLAQAPVEEAPHV
jgi:nitrate reductase delta subunit